MIDSAKPYHGLPLWNNLRAGMSKAEVTALYPKRRIPLSQGCNAALDFNFWDGLSDIQMEWSVYDDENTACGVSVLNSLVKKYGDPDDVTIVTKIEVDDGTCGGLANFGKKLRSFCNSQPLSEPSVKRKIVRQWERQGVTMILRMDADKEAPRKWHLSYEPTEKPVIKNVDEIEGL